MTNQTVVEKRRIDRGWEAEKECAKIKNEYSKLLNEYEEFKNKQIDMSQYNINVNKSTFKSDFNKSHLNPNINFIDNYGQTDRDIN